PSTDPRVLPYPYNYPTFNKLKCAQPMYSYKDTKYTVSDGCMKILRDWKVIDWCQYKPNTYPTVGQWTYTQVIKLIVSDSTAKLICPLDTIIQSTMNCKGAYVKLDSAKAISKCGFLLSIKNNSPYSKSKGPDASGDYPLGTTEFYYTAEYGCGKEIKCKVRVTVKNKIGPVPYCLNGLIVALMPVDTNKDGTPDDGMIAVWAKDFNLGSYHPCGYKKLTFSFSADTSFKSRIFTCADLGKNEVQMWVTDSLGNQSYCKTYLEVQNNSAQIPDCKRKDSITTTITVSGLVTDDQNQNLSDVKTVLKMKSGYKIIPSLIPVIKTWYDTIVRPNGLKLYIRHTDTTYITKYDTISNQWSKELFSASNGTYKFGDLIKGQDYYLSLNKREFAYKGIDINDLIVLLKHISGSQPIVNTYKLVAADINSDGAINQIDFDLLYDVVSGAVPYESLPFHWRFVRKAFVFTNPLNPFLNNFDQAFEIPAIAKSLLNVDYMAIRVGELDGITKGVINIQLQDRNARPENSLNAFQVVNLFPNPFQDQPVNFQLELMRPATLTVSWYNVAGKLLIQNVRSFDKGLQFWEQDLKIAHASGILIYKITDGQQVKYGKLSHSE
ncbi:MAG: T9SS type A sorting domain-containing protein, partial [Saprospiraceae bacterium]